MPRHIPASPQAGSLFQIKRGKKVKVETIGTFNSASIRGDINYI